MRIAVIGLGGIARKAYLPILAARADLELLLSAATQASIDTLQARYRIAWGSRRLAEVIDRRPHAAFVLTPDETHFEIVTRLLDAGIDVFVEKPATLHASQTQELAEKADRYGRILMVGFNRRFAPLHVQARQLLTGQPVNLAVFQKDRANPAYSSLRDQFYNDNIHQIDLLRYYCGEGHALETVSQSAGGKIITAAATVALDQGGLALVLTSMQAGRWNETYAVHGGGQSMFIDAFTRLRSITPQGERVWEEPYASSWESTLDGRGFSQEIDHFLTCIKTRQAPSTSAWDSIKTQTLVEDLLARAAHPD